jgi:hypothetical protein
MTGELPLRIIDQPGGATVRCLCGAEAATLRRASTGMLRMRGAVSLPGLSPDVSPAGLLMMIAHAKQCERGRELAARRPPGQGEFVLGGYAP